ncbi:heavy metal translocating P-type ATPase [Alloscardovia macacae]
MLFVTLAVLVALLLVPYIVPYTVPYTAPVILPGHDSAAESTRILLVAALVLATVADTLRGMIADIREGHVGLDILAVVAILSTLAVGEYWASWTVVLMIYSGAAIEEYAERSAQQNLTTLLAAVPQVAHVLSTTSAVSAHAAEANTAESHTARDLPAADVQVMDVLQVLPGETVPVDGVLLSDRAVVDLSMINGEPLPRTVLTAQRVPSGAVNGAAAFTMRATARAADSQYQRIVALVESARSSRPQVVKTADLLAVPFTVLAFAIAGIAWFVSGTPLRFAQVLVLATPCPLLIAAPVAYLGGTSQLSARGVLIKTQDVIEQLTRVTHIFFDKTGTLTVKQPRVIRVERTAAHTAISDALLLAAAGAVESYSIHILARGITRAGEQARSQLTTEELELLNPEHISHVVEHSGLGISAQIDGHTIRIGREAFVTQNSEDEGFARAGLRRNQRQHHRDLEPSSMAAYVSLDGELLGRIILADTARDEARKTVEELESMGKQIFMLTGDGPDAARAIAHSVGIADERVHAALLPEGKQRIVQATRGVTLMVGDGVNDAPVLASADVGVALTDGSSTAASETAQLVIMNDDLSALPDAIRIAQRTRTVMLQAVLLGLSLAVVGMLAAAFGMVPAVVGAFGQEAIDVVSIVWALTAVRSHA